MHDHHRHCGATGGINKVNCGPKLFHLTSALLVVWSGLLWPSVWLTVYTAWSAVSTGIINLPTHPLHPSHPLSSTHPFIRGIRDMVGCVQNISQNQPVHPVAIQVSVMIAIVPLYFCCKSYMATIKHKKPIIFLIFQISNFSKSRNVCTWSVFQNQVTYETFIIYLVNAVYTR